MENGKKIFVNESEIEEKVITNQHEEQEQKEKEIQEQKKTIEQNIRSTQIFSVILTMTIITMFNFLKFISNSLSVFFLGEAFQMPLPDLISFLVNLVLIFGLMLLLINFPRLTQKSIVKLSCILTGIILGIIIMALYLLYVENQALSLTIHGEPFYFAYLFIWFPFIGCMGLVFWRKNADAFFTHLFFFLTAFILTLFILDSPHIIVSWDFYLQHGAFSGLVISFSIIAGIYLVKAIGKKSFSDGKKLIIIQNSF